MSPNISYRRGRAKEYRLKKKYEEKGFIVIRSAGSHSFADLVTIHRKSKLVLFIQSKPKNFSQKAAARLYDEYDWIGPEPFDVDFIVE